MSARAEIFANIRRSLGVNGQEAPRRRSVEDRLENAPQGLVPARGQHDAEGLRTLFRSEAERVAASVSDVATPSELPRAIADLLRQRNLPAKIRIGEDPMLADLPWQTTNLDVATGPSAGEDLVCVTHAFAGVAETGTLVMTASKENPTSLNFLPDLHIVVLRAEDLKSDFEKVWPKLRSAFGKGTMPRVLNFITGPSRTRDIAQKSLRGVHGPRNLHIIIVAEN
jgi:L-lactate dehydrogenase complex protein LldG